AAGAVSASSRSRWRSASGLLAAVPGAELLERRVVDLIGARDGDADLRQRVQRPGACTFEDRPLADDRAGADLRERLTVGDDLQHAVEEEEELVAGVALLDEVLALLHRPDLGLLAALHDRRRELAFERGLDRGDEGLGVLVTPRCVESRRGAVPVLELGEPRL